MGMDEVLQRIDAKKFRLDAARPLPSASVQSLMEDFRIRYTHETTAIEGNTLTLRETQAVVQHGLTVHGKPLRDHLEVINAVDALDWLDEAVKRGDPPSQKLIMELHRLLMKGILKQDAGDYRTVPVFIQGANHIPPNWRKVPQLMEAFEAWLKAENEHTIVFAAKAHIRLARIHPFVDGNGRTCRLLVNYILMQHGYPPALYTTEKRDAYMNALDDVERGEDDPFIHLTAEAVEWTLDRYLLIVGDTMD